LELLEDELLGCFFFNLRLDFPLPFEGWGVTGFTVV